MPDRYLLESGSPDGYLLEDGSGVLLLEFVSPSISWNNSDRSTWSAQTVTGTNNETYNADAGAGGANSAVRSSTSIGSGKYYFRLTRTGSAAVVCGLATANYGSGGSIAGVVAAGSNLSETSGARAIAGIAGQDLYPLNVYATTLGGSGNYTDIAFDVDAGKVWFGDGTSYDGSPTAGTGGRSLPAGAVFPFAYITGASTSVTIDSLSNATTNAPSGFTALGAGAAAAGYTLTAAAGAFALTGTATTLKRGLKLTAAAGAFSLSGTAANLKRGLKLTAASGAFSLSGTAASFPVTRKLTAAAGSFALSGTAASLKRGLKISAASGSFALTGTAATLTKSSVTNFTLTAASGSFAISGTAATLKRGLKLSAAAGSYSLTGTAANLKRGLRLTANSGSYALTGAAVNFASSGSRTMTALPAAFVITGSASTRRLNSAGGGGSIAFFLS